MGRPSFLEMRDRRIANYARQRTKGRRSENQSSRALAVDTPLMQPAWTLHSIEKEEAVEVVDLML